MKETQLDFSKITKLIDQEIEKGTLPGAVLAVTTNDSVPLIYSAGYAHKEKEVKVTKETLYDLASLTKVTSTLPAILLLLEAGEIDLDDPVYNYVQSFKEHNDDITIKHLLTHTSGYPPEIKFYQRNLTMEAAVVEIAGLTAKKPAGTEVIYSDLNYIVLGYITEQVSGMPLDEYTANHIYKPLGMKNTFFNPPEHLRMQTAATEFRESLNDYQWGEVHDENATNFNGISGHAGLFSTGGDMIKYCQLFLNKGVYQEKMLLSPLTIELAADCYTDSLNLSRGLGWQLHSTGVFSGQFLQKGYGHTGFTGTSMWISPEKNLAIVLLTNRVHYGRENNINSLRRKLHNVIAVTMKEKGVI
ncbi:serine hydrolase domain-containing protein [Jeotgalibacillus haloalkalitolerans]|uniref:Serine hydrolase domain-containing protein n=1 Tax=Jeotgalibacillus haloalkalitolerans TaxID=3104292 RepID=A0ABU5KJA0_9BACL|nr:serine hydrolase domain-containing protein [Jeotgalibacillus sp. HH7-29]MDZ5710996.1 serine hydrolase domain-containing protein [Jeotgalibacillus sp. HH7-29]